MMKAQRSSKRVKYFRLLTHESGTFPQHWPKSGPAKGSPQAVTPAATNGFADPSGRSGVCFSNSGLEI